MPTSRRPRTARPRPVRKSAQVAKDKGTAKSVVKRALPYVVAVGVGLLLFMIWSKMSGKLGGAQATGAVLNTNNSAMPWYNDYQSELPRTAEAKQEQANPEPMGYDYQGAIPPAPLCRRCNKKVCECWLTWADRINCGKMGCMDSSAFNFDPQATIPCTNCCVRKIYGTMDPRACNYDPRANVPWRFAQYCKDLPGCSDPSALNYSGATIDDGSCVPQTVGCMQKEAVNYNAAATVACEDCCMPSVPGCTSPNAPNFNPAATKDDGSCILPQAGCVNPQAANFQPAAVVNAPATCKASLPAAIKTCGGVLGGGMCRGDGTSPIFGAYSTCSPFDITSHDLGTSATGW